MSERYTLKRLNEEYWRKVPDNLQGPRWFDWYLAALYEDPRVARGTHQRVADMFDHYGTRYDDERGFIYYAFAVEDRLYIAEKTSYNCGVYGAIHELVNKVKFSARNLEIRKRIKLLS